MAVVTFSLLTNPSLPSFREPKIVIADQSIELPSYCQEGKGQIVAAGFKLANVGDLDGFATVELVARGSVIGSDRVFVRAKGDATGSIGALWIPDCSVRQEDLQIRISRLEVP